jgi:hypothetical protein
MWDESRYIMREIGNLHVFANPSISYVTFTGEERTRREWPLLGDDSQINKSASGFPEDAIMQTIPYDIMTEFDELLFSQRIRRVPRFPLSTRTTDFWEQLMEEQLTEQRTDPLTEQRTDTLTEQVTDPLTEPLIPQPVAPTGRTLPKHIYDIVLADAVRTKKECPIAMEPITLENGSVTICGHVFTKNALTQWLKDNLTCPECRTNL